MRHHQRHAGDVGVEDLGVAGLEVGVVGGFADGDAGVVDEDIEAGEVVSDSGFCGFDAFFAGDVEFDDVDVAVLDAEFFELLKRDLAA